MLLSGAAPINSYQQYIDDVTTGRQVACKTVQQSVRRHVDDLKHAERRGYYFDADEAECAIRFFSLLRHSKGEWAGQPFILSAWQAFLVAMLFGWKRVRDGFRRFREAYLEVARKNGKSTLLAGLGLLLFIGDLEPGSEVYTAATKRDQALIVHSESIRMVESSPSLHKRIEIKKNNLSDRKTHSKYEPLASDARTTDGLNIHGAILDELHEHKTRELFDVLVTGTGARRQPLIVSITTAGDGSRKHSICKEKHDYTKKILDPENPTEDDEVFGYIATIDEGDDWTDPAVWEKANPNWGVSVKPEMLESLLLQAKASPGAEANFRRKLLNEWVETSTAWLAHGVWDACKLPCSPDLLAGRPCYGGLDLATVNDLTAFVLAFPPTDDDEKWRIVPHFWCPREGAEKRSRDDGVPYVAWAERGLMTLTDTFATDYAAIRKHINEAGETYKIQSIGFDPYNSSQIVLELGDQDGFEMTTFRQGFLSMSPAIKATERMLLEGDLAHDGHEVLAWNIANAAETQDAAENKKFDKARSGDKIDGAVALVMAVGLAVSRTEQTSIYEERGIIEL